MTLLEKNKILRMRGKWYRIQQLDFMWEYIYIKGISESFGYETIATHKIEIHQSKGDSHRYSAIHLDSDLFYNKKIIRLMKEITNKKTIATMDNMLGELFYVLK